MKVLTLNAKDAEVKTCLAIRQEVFVEEQNVPLDLELDGLDSVATHFLLVDEAGQGVATARIRLLEEGSSVKIERVAVRKAARGKGFGRDLMVHILSEIKKNETCQTVLLEAQEYILPFYEQLGFHAHGGTFMDAGIPHKKMSQSLTKEKGKFDVCDY